MAMIDGEAGLAREIYDLRFSDGEGEARGIVWELLCRHFLQNFIAPSDTVVDIGAGEGHFLRHIVARRKVAVDCNPRVTQLGREGIEVLQEDATAFAEKFDGKADVVFMSNFLEHLPEKRLIFSVLGECRHILRPGGRLLVLQPNARHVGAAYWDYVDHYIALTEKSLEEALLVSGFRIEKLISRFLPYTVKSRLGRCVRGSWGRWLVRVYLSQPVLWRLFGQQTFVVATAEEVGHGLREGREDFAGAET